MIVFSPAIIMCSVSSDLHSFKLFQRFPNLSIYCLMLRFPICHLCDIEMQDMLGQNDLFPAFILQCVASGHMILEKIFFYRRNHQWWEQEGEGEGFGRLDKHPRAPRCTLWAVTAARLVVINLNHLALGRPWAQCENYWPSRTWCSMHSLLVLTINYRLSWQCNFLITIVS